MAIANAHLFFLKRELQDLQASINIASKGGIIAYFHAWSFGCKNPHKWLLKLQKRKLDLTNKLNTLVRELEKKHNYLDNGKEPIEYLKRQKEILIEEVEEMEEDMADLETKINSKYSEIEELEQELLRGSK